MRSEKLFDAITDIDENIIEEADNFTFSKNSSKKALPFIFTAAAVFLVLFMLGSRFDALNFSSEENATANNSVQDISQSEAQENTFPSEESITQNSLSESEKQAYTLSKASFPSLSPYPLTDDNGMYDSEAGQKWRQDIYELSKTKADTDAVFSFSKKAMTEFLGTDDGKNKLLSPLNLYLALAAAAETAGGSSRNQLLKLLEADSIEALRENAKNIWLKNYRDDGVMKNALATSVWLNDSLKYKKPAIDRLSSDYYASVFSGEMGSDGYNKMLNHWINDNTGNILSPDFSTHKDDVMVLASTILYNSKWRNEFNAEKTVDGIFKGTDGEKEVSFMNSDRFMLYYWGENFSAVALEPDIGGRMWLILPDEGVKAEEIFSDSEAMRLISVTDNGLTTEYEKSKHLKVKLSMPKFDIMNEVDLARGIKRLGVTDIFSPESSDFSPLLTDDTGVFVSQINHAVRVKVDEEGITAAAYTVMLYCGSALPPDEEVEFVLDRPFVFVLNLDGTTPLFAGVVNNP